MVKNKINYNVVVVQVVVHMMELQSSLLPYIVVLLFTAATTVF